MTALKTPEQITQAKSPIWPADPATFDYQGSNYDVYRVPVEGLGSLPWWRKGGPKANSSTRPTRKPASSRGGLLADARPGVAVRPAMDQLWRGLDPHQLPEAAVQHLAIAVIGTIGTVVSCTLVACGFAASASLVARCSSPY